MPDVGILTKRKPDAREIEDIEYGLGVARHIAAMDLGQTVVVRDRACVAIEAMEGTDETIERAARITGGAELTVVKVSKPKQDMRFDVPVVGLPTVEVMKRCKATALAIDAHRTLLFDRAELIAAADAAGITIQAFEPIGWRKTAAERRKKMTDARRIRVAVVGAGEFGRNHARVYSELPGAELVGIVDTNAERAKQ